MSTRLAAMSHFNDRFTIAKSVCHFHHHFVRVGPSNVTVLEFGESRIIYVNILNNRYLPINQGMNVIEPVPWSDEDYRSLQQLHRQK